MSARWKRTEVVVSSFCSLVAGGRSVRSVAQELDIPVHVGYRIAHEHDLPLQRRPTTAAQAEEVATLWRQGLKPMDIVRATALDPTPVYRIGMELGFWQRSKLFRRAESTRQHCEYLQLLEFIPALPWTSTRAW